MNKKVVVYSTPTCHFCHLAKDYFVANKIEYTDHDVTVDAAARAEMVEKTGQMGVPVIIIDDEVTVGFDKDRLDSLLGVAR